MCDDMEQKLVQWVYYFAFRLEDEEGDLIDVVICDEGVRSIQIHIVSTDDLFHVPPLRNTSFLVCLRVIFQKGTILTIFVHALRDYLVI